MSVASVAGLRRRRRQARQHPSRPDFFRRLKGMAVFEVIDLCNKLVAAGCLLRSASGRLRISTSGVTRLRSAGLDTLGAEGHRSASERMELARRAALDAAVARACEGLRQQQLEVVQAVVEQRRSIFFTGAAGTGKSFTLRRLVSILKDQGHNVAVTASTGVAACALGGSTVHSWAGVGRGEGAVEAVVATAASRRSVRERWHSASVLVIDEVSMLSADFMDLLDVVGQRCRGSTRPFGGLQLVLVGDFCQLPPIGKGGRSPRFAFQSRAWKAAVQRSIVLRTVFRQGEDPAFVQLLSKLRFGQMDASVLAGLEPCQAAGASGPSVHQTHLCSVNAVVDARNARELGRLPGRGVTYTAQELLPENPAAQQRGQALLRQLKAGTIAKLSLTLKVGAAVMLLHNLDVRAGLTNGTRGEVVGFAWTSAHSAKQRAAASETGVDAAPLRADAPLPAPLVRFTVRLNGRVRQLDPMPVQPHKFLLSESPQNWAGLRQIPLALAWAMTIHKSQGMTLHGVHVDAGGIFEQGQAYVALSRSSSLAGLSLAAFKPASVKVHPTALAFHTSLGDGLLMAEAAPKTSTQRQGGAAQPVQRKRSAAATPPGRAKPSTTGKSVGGAKRARDPGSLWAASPAKRGAAASRMAAALAASKAKAKAAAKASGW